MSLNAAWHLVKIAHILLDMEIRPFLLSDVIAVKEFADQQIGADYFSLEELYDIQARSQMPTGDITSFVLVDNRTNQIKGLRLAYAPGKWNHGKGQGLRPDLWPHPLNQTGYFQSLFLSSDVQGQGWGPRLSEKVIQLFRRHQVKGIVTHSWKESPNNSSVKYLEKMGFKKMIEHPLYWINVDYHCSLDGKPCRCTAVEMYLEL